MNSTTDEDVKLSKLIRQWTATYCLGKTPRDAEVGPKTWKFLLETTNSPKDAIEGYFMGMRIRPGDVPEGKLWPLESAK